MRKIISAAIISMSLFMSACTEIVGNREVVYESRDVSGFKSIDIQIPADVFFKIDDAFSMEIEGESNIISEVISRIDNDELNLEFKDNINFRYAPQEKIKINISAPQLIKVYASGSSSFTTNSTLREGAFVCKASGASTINISNLSIDKGKLICSGASNINIDKTSANELIINTSGASNVDMGYAIIGDMDVDQSGASNVVIKTGNGKDCLVEMSGASKFESKMFLMKRADIRGSGASEAMIFAEESLKANISGASTIIYGGSPSSEIKTSGAASVKNKPILQETLYKTDTQ